MRSRNFPPALLKITLRLITTYVFGFIGDVFVRSC